MAAMLFILL